MQCGVYKVTKHHCTSLIPPGTSNRSFDRCIHMVYTVPAVHMCPIVLKGVLLIPTPYLYVANMNIAKTNLVDDSFRLLSEGFLGSI